MKRIMAIMLFFFCDAHTSATALLDNIKIRTKQKKNIPISELSKVTRGATEAAFAKTPTMSTPELTDTRQEEVAALLPCSLSSYVLLKRLPWRRAYIPSRSAAQRKCIMCVCECVNGGLLQSLGGRSRDFHGNLGTPTSPSVPRCVTKLGDRTVWRFVLANLSVSILLLMKYLRLLSKENVI